MIDLDTAILVLLAHAGMAGTDENILWLKQLLNLETET